MQAPEARGLPAELLAFQRRYWAAWDAADLAAVGECLDGDFRGTFCGPQGAEILQLDRAAATELLAASFALARGARAHWRRSGVVWLERGPQEAAAAMRVDALFPDHPAWNNAELTLETYRRGPDGRWRILRVHSERLR